ncbi:MAG: DUF4129 domain-containing protein [Firmicutes bacterium]|nr:DUF4129 domain-containing protein [Bacillota bacterium]
MMRFLRNSIWDMALCLGMIFACATSIFSGFHVPEEQAGAYAVTLACGAALVVLMNAASCSRRTLIIGLGALLAVFAGLIVYSVTAQTGAFADSEENPLLRFVLLALTGIAVFAASRFRLGTILLLPAGAVTLGLIEFLYETEHIVCLLLFLVTASGMIVYRNYINNILRSRTLKTAQTSAVIYSLIICLLAAALGSGIYYGIVQPLHPPKKELKLITKYLSLEVLEKIGVADIEQIEDPNLTTDQQSDQQDTTQQDSEEKDDTLNDTSTAADTNSSSEGTSPDQMDKRQKGPLQAIRYDWGIPLWAVWILIILAAAFAAVLLKRHLRKRWFRKLREGPPEEQVRQMYAFCLKKFRQLKIRPVKGETPYEFAARTADQLALFRRDCAGFMEITDAMVRLEYGGQEPAEEDLNSIAAFYRHFYRNLREHLGKVQYIIRYFVL